MQQPQYSEMKVLGIQVVVMHAADVYVVACDIWGIVQHM